MLDKDALIQSSGGGDGVNHDGVRGNGVRGDGVKGDGVSSDGASAGGEGEERMEVKVEEVKEKVVGVRDPDGHYFTLELSSGALHRCHLPPLYPNKTGTVFFFLGGGEKSERIWEEVRES